MREIGYVLILSLSLAGLRGLAASAITVRATAQNVNAVSGAVSAASVDPNKAPSEFNHHVAGWALIGVGLLVLTSFLSRDLGVLRYVWPPLFLLAGLFLALWSDAEIWPRGNMNWAWLVHHDREAGQHKVYALLLIGIGIVEYLRACGSLNRFWRTWAFPILAIVGAASLLVHDHTASSDATLPEASAYLVNPALGPDGKPPAPRSTDPMHGIDHSMMDMDHSAIPMDYSSTNYSSMPIGKDQPITSTQPFGHHHRMTPSMLMVEREHFWFMVVGLGVALFKLIADGKLWHRRFIPCVWPSAVVLLGVLLVLYQE